MQQTNRAGVANLQEHLFNGLANISAVAAAVTAAVAVHQDQGGRGQRPRLQGGQISRFIQIQEQFSFQRFDGHYSKFSLHREAARHSLH